MKKTYMTPAAVAIRIEKVLLQSASNQTMDVKSGSVSNTSDLLGRRGFFDDDED